jgi:glucuronate isomerase
MMKRLWELSEDRFFDLDPTQRRIARELYKNVAAVPILSPHGHVDPSLFANPQANFGSPVDLLIIPDHYVFRMLYSQGISLDALGIARLDDGLIEHNHRRIWQTFADQFYLFRGTPTGTWLAYSMSKVFGIQERLDSKNAQDIYDQLAARLSEAEFQPRRLFERFNIEVLCTTDAAWDRLDHHQAIRSSGWYGNIRPTFRPDGVINLDTPGWGKNIDALSQASGISIHTYQQFIQALEYQRAYFKSLGATATDHAALTPYTQELETSQAEEIFKRALRSETLPDDAQLFTGHMLIEMARMSVEDGLVMQIHPGSLRNHNYAIYHKFGPDMGADIPILNSYTIALRPLLKRFGDHLNFTLILFTLDESTYARELAPLAGHYPAVRLGPPWWFHDSLNGMRRYFDRVMETAGIYNTAGFNDDTRAFPSIPARHDVWRRACANWLAGLVVRGLIGEDEAAEMIHDLVYNLAKKAYRLNAE